jgi:23S rRNA (guanine745-N1)-methyltransferase
MSPRKVMEFDRVLKPDGRLLMVVPGAGHLAEVRKALLLRSAEEADKIERSAEACDRFFALEGQRTVSFEMHLDQAEIQQLIGMTPLAWKSNRAALEEVAQLDALTVQANFALLSFLRR